MRNADVEAKKKIRTIKSAVQPEGDIHSPRTFMFMLGERPPIEMSGLGVRICLNFDGYPCNS